MLDRLRNFLTFSKGTKGLGTPDSMRVLSTLYALRGLGSGLWTGGENLSYIKATKDGYKSIVWVYLCLQKLATAMSSVNWKVYEIQRDGTEVYVPNHPIELMMSSPNPHYGRRELFEAFSFCLGLAGRSFWEVVYVQKKPYQLYPVRPDYMKPIPDPDTYIKGWKFDPRGTSQPIEFEPAEIIEFRYLDPTDEYGALSPLTSAARTMESENAAIAWNKAVLDNGAVPGGILTIPAQTLQNVNKAEIKASLEEEFTGENRYRTMLLWGGMEWEKMSLDHTQVQFLDQRKVNKYELCAVLETPPQIVGAQEDPTYSNYSVARLSYWEDTVMPRLEWVQTKLNSRLVVPFWGPNFVVRYDASDVPALREAFKIKVESGHKLWQMGYPINMINAKLKLGMDEVPWGNTAFIPVSSMPASAIVDEEGRPIPQPEPEPEPQPDDEDNPGDPEEAE